MTSTPQISQSLQAHECVGLRSARHDVLAVRNLGVRTSDGVPLVSSLDLSIASGEVVALVGESGSGKSLTCLSVIGLLDDGLTASGSVSIDRVELLSGDGRAQRNARGSEVAIIFQDPVASLNPIRSIGALLHETVRYHNPKLGRRQVEEAACELLIGVGLHDPNRIKASYAHELSGGMCQRAMIALALAGNPKVLLADEPTTALDVTTQAQVLALIKDLARSRGLSVLLITHDLGVVAAFSDMVHVMYRGRIIEKGETASLLSDPCHPYTRQLVAAAFASIDEDFHDEIVFPAVGPADRGAGCAFIHRCDQAIARCASEMPQLQEAVGGRLVSCHRHGDAARLR